MPLRIKIQNTWLYCYNKGMRKKALIFDFFGVISTKVAAVWLQNNFNKKQIPILKEKYLCTADLGEISENILFDALGKLVSRTPESVRQEWLELSRINTQIVDLIRNLSHSYKIALCTDASSNFIREI